MTNIPLSKFHLSYLQEASVRRFIYLRLIIFPHVFIRFVQYLVKMFFFLKVVFAFAANLLTLDVLLRSPRLKFAISLALSDIFMAISSGFFSTQVLICGEWPFDRVACQFYGYFGHIYMSCHSATSLRLLADFASLASYTTSLFWKHQAKPATFWPGNDTARSDHNTGTFLPYSFRTLRGLFYVPQGNCHMQ